MLWEKVQINIKILPFEKDGRTYLEAHLINQKEL